MRATGQSGLTNCWDNIFERTQHISAEKQSKNTTCTHYVGELMLALYKRSLSIGNAALENGPIKSDVNSDTLFYCPRIYEFAAEGK